MPRKLRRNPMYWLCRREREREVSAQLTQARKESLRSHSSEGQKASEKSDALFSFEQGNLGVLCSETLIRRIREDLFLKATRITWSIRQDRTWRSKSFMSSPSTSASVNYNDKRKSKDWRYRTHKYGFDVRHFRENHETIQQLL